MSVTRKRVESSFTVPYYNWRRPLPRPIVIPTVMALETLEPRQAAIDASLNRRRLIVSQN
jgi:hypothetical protein